MEWISVKDGLPEEGQSVLIWDGTYMNCAEILCKNDETTTWIFGACIHENVTHWSPPPEPPEKK